MDTMEIESATENQNPENGTIAGQAGDNGVYTTTSIESILVFDLVPVFGSFVNSEYEKIQIDCDSFSLKYQNSQLSSESSQSGEGQLSVANISNQNGLQTNNVQFTSWDELYEKTDMNDVLIASQAGVEMQMKKKKAPMMKMNVKKMEDGTISIGCPGCEEVNHDKAVMEEHLTKMYGGKHYICDICGIIMKRNYHIMRHKEIHKTERPFNCNICHKTFKRNEHLNLHKLVHTDIKEKMCDKCGKCFQRIDYLNKHLKMHKNQQHNMEL